MLECISCVSQTTGFIKFCGSAHLKSGHNHTSNQGLQKFKKFTCCQRVDFKILSFNVNICNFYACSDIN